MATYTVNKAVHKTLVASTVDTVSLAIDANIRIVNRDGVSEIYFTVDGTTPTVGGDNCYVLPAQIGSVVVPSGDSNNIQVNLISSGTAHYSVEGAYLNVI